MTTHALRRRKRGLALVAATAVTLFVAACATGGDPSDAGSGRRGLDGRVSLDATAPRDGGASDGDGGPTTTMDSGVPSMHDGGTPIPRDGGATPIDAGPRDAGPRDAGPRDAGPTMTCGDGTCGAAESCSTCVDCRAGHLGSGENGDPCPGVPAEQWRCVNSASFGATVSQVCRAGAWVSFNLRPSNCTACVCTYSTACRQ